MLVATFPSFGSPAGPAFLSMIFSVALTTRAKWRGLPRDEIRWAAFEGVYYGTGIGLIVLLMGAATGLY